jgi:hypothetical protein
MRTFLPTLAAACAALAAPALALPAIQHVQVGNVTSSSLCVCWDAAQSAAPGLEVFTDAGATHEVTTEARLEFQVLDNSRREVSSSYAERQGNRAIQAQMAAKGVALVRVSGLAAHTQYFLRPLGLNASGATVDSGALVPVTTATTSLFVPESRQLAVNLSPMVPTTGDVAGTLLVVSCAASPYPLIAVVGDSFSPTFAYFDLSCFLNAAGESNLLPAAGPLDLTITWLGLPPFPGYFAPSAVAYTGTTTVAAATESTFNGQGVVVHATPTSPYAVAGLPIFLDLSVTDIGGVSIPGFNHPLLIESAALASGAGATPALAAGQLSGYPLTFATPGTHTVTLRDSASSTYTTLDVRVIQMNYQNWRAYHLGTALAGGAPGDDPDRDGNSNLIEYVSGSDPSSPSGSMVAIAPPGASALRLRFNLNPLQTEYAVVIQVTPDLATWHNSTKVPALLETRAGHKVMEVAWTKAELQAATGVVSPSYFARLLLAGTSNYNTWANSYSLPAAAAPPSANPDGDPIPNFAEFALDSDPTSGVSSGKVQPSRVTIGTSFAGVLTLPMRLGATPASTDPPGGELVFEADGVRYRIQGSTNLTSWGLTILEVPVDASSLPQLGSGYEYRSFRTPSGRTYRMEFIRAMIELLPP